MAKYRMVKCPNPEGSDYYVIEEQVLGCLWWEATAGFGLTQEEAMKRFEKHNKKREVVKIWEDK